MKEWSTVSIILSGLVFSISIVLLLICSSYLFNTERIIVFEVLLGVLAFVFFTSASFIKKKLN
ncbi:hypothetical protein AN965_12485 [Alkalicoccobacillus plakortidis]|uniref:Uncharacterized protein n=1 Tax=Alkalicoccobacillus plakortidis TaxID=444060 RepID=A0A9D5I0I0_9BACI|nr:hypothetical protein AN965_12485 [Alkalicoccobacillus plakortidis]